MARHLLTRAGLGATADEVRRALAAGRDATIERLLSDTGSGSKPEILGRHSLHGGLVSPDGLHARLESRRVGYLQLQSDFFAPLNRFGVWWMERMLAGEAPLRDRMTIFWHGHLVSSFKEVGSSYEIIDQILFLRQNALGPFDTLVRGIARDPAMLQYLSNAKNVKTHPNENWARELMELFTLGDGHYTEEDIKESARAFTGWSKDPAGFAYRRLDHDFGQKTVLGVTGNLDGEDVIHVVLSQPACPRFLASKLITHLEGVPPDEERLQEYADQFRGEGLNVGNFLRRLLSDPRFYRDEVIGARVEAPVEYLIGVARRLDLHPPGEMVMAAGGVIGQRLFFPPSVKGWEGGMNWITTGSIMQRSNMVGVMLGLLDIGDLTGVPTASMPSMPKPRAEDNQARTSGVEMLRHIQVCGWEPKISLRERIAGHLSGSSDAEIVRYALDELLLTPPAEGTAGSLERWLHGQRQELGIAEGGLLSNDAHAEELLRHIAHLVLSLPEAQLD